MISMHNVGMRFPGGITALQPTSIKFERGRFTVLLGPSGAGKSTLLRCLNFLNSPSTGTVHINGLGILNGDRKRLLRHRLQTAMIFQQHQLIGRYSALKNVLIGRVGNFSTLRSLLPLPKEDLKVSLECLERVGLLDKAMERVDNLSGGQQQRVGIARGLAQQPLTILADEPVASLDPVTSKKILSLLHRICKEDGITTIVSLHQVDLALDYADRLIGLAGGSVVFDGRAENLHQRTLDRIYGKNRQTIMDKACAENGHPFQKVVHGD
jgi:phosphonate transport system ATP-binding protein